MSSLRGNHPQVASTPNQTNTDGSVNHFAKCFCVFVHEVIEGGAKVPFIQGGKVVEGVHTIVGGAKVKRKFIDPMGSRFVRYTRGEFRSEDELAASNLCFYPGVYKGQTWVGHPQSFMKWGKNILNYFQRVMQKAIERTTQDSISQRHSRQLVIGIENVSAIGIQNVSA